MLEIALSAVLACADVCPEGVCPISTPTPKAAAPKAVVYTGPVKVIHFPVAHKVLQRLAHPLHSASVLHGRVKAIRLGLR